MNKITEFIERNRIRNAHLYVSGLIEGEDYIVCPVSKERVSMIKKNYITNVLGMNIEDYPQVARVCKKRKENIKLGLKQVDEETGLTKHELSVIKAKESLSEIDENGISGYKKKGEKTRTTHMSNVDALGRNGYSQLATKAIIKGNKTKATKGLILDPTSRDEFYRYKLVVLRLTEKHRAKLVAGYKTGLAGTPGAYHLDHRYSIMQGYVNKVSPLLIGHEHNLKMIPWEKNLSKHSKSEINLQDLLDSIGYTLQQSIDEFYITMNLIKTDIENLVPSNGSYLLARLYESTLCK